MPIAAHVPVRIRLDERALDTRGADIADALGSAVSRALANCSEQVVEPRGGYQRVLHHAAEISWTGPLAHRVPPDRRRRVEALVRETLRERIEAAALGAVGVEARANAPDVLPDEFRERFDHKRSRGEFYLVPSYGEPKEALPYDVPLWLNAKTWQTAHEQPGSLRYWYWTGEPGELVKVARRVLAQYDPHGTKLSDQSLIGFLLSYRTHALHVVLARCGNLRELSRPLRFGGFVIVKEPDDGKAAEAQPTQPDAYGEFAFELGRAFSSREDGRAALRAIGFGEQFAAYSEGQFDSSSGHVAVIYAPDTFTFLVQNPGIAVDQGVRIPLLPITVFYKPSEDEDAGEGEGTGTGGGKRGKGAGRRADAGGEGESGAEPGEGQDAAEGPTAIVVDPTAAEEQKKGRRFPIPNDGGPPLEIDLDAFDGEPSLTQLGADGEELRRLMRRIAFRLDMPDGEYAGAFCIAAAQVLGTIASMVGRYSSGDAKFTRPLDGTQGNLGAVQFEPQPSPAMQFLEYLAETVPFITRLHRAIESIYRYPQVRGLFTGHHSDGNVTSWVLHFFMELSPAMKESVGFIFMQGCKIVLLQLLRHSADEIRKRRENFENYYPLFEALMVGFISQEAELRELRDKLISAKAWMFGSGSAMVKSAFSTWREARQAFSFSLSQQLLNVASVAAPLSGSATAVAEPNYGSLVPLPDGGVGIIGRQDRVWTMEELEQAIAIRSGTATAVDPLVQQVQDLPQAVAAFKSSPTIAKAYLRQLLKEMADNNRDKTGEAEGSAIFAFRASKINESLKEETVAGTGVALQGVHLLVHQSIGAAFHGDQWYALALGQIFGIELGRKALIDFLEFAGTMLLSIVCPPLGTAVGIAVAAVHRYQAGQQADLYNALIEPELVISRAEVEMDLFLSELELALAIIPDAGAIISRVARGAATLGRQGVRQGARIIGQQLRHELMEAMMEQVKRGLAKAFLHAIVTDQAMRIVVPKVIGPMMEIIYREVALLSVAGPAYVPGVSPEPEPVEPTPQQVELLRRLDEEGTIKDN